MRKAFFPLLFLLLVLALAAFGPDTPADDPAQTAGEAPAEEAPEDFVPSEKLPADSAISFPVDI